jgi:hypothetical protein
MKKLFVKTYGCQMNAYDSAKMADLLAPLGYAATDSPEAASPSKDCTPVSEKRNRAKDAPSLAPAGTGKVRVLAPLPISKLLKMRSAGSAQDPFRSKSIQRS